MGIYCYSKRQKNDKKISRTCDTCGSIDYINIRVVYILNNLSPVGSDIKIILKYLVFGTGLIILILIVAITLMSLITIIFGISWLKKTNDINTI